MSDQFSSSDDESLIGQDVTETSTPLPTDGKSPDAHTPKASATQPDYRPRRPASRTPRRRKSPSPPPSRHPPSSPASSYASAHPAIPAIEKWTVLSLRQALTNADIYYSKKMNKAELYNLFISLQPTPRSPKSTPRRKATNKTKHHKTPSLHSPNNGHPSSLARPVPSCHTRKPSASLGRAPDPVAKSPVHPRSAERRKAACSAPHATTLFSDTGLPSSSNAFPPAAMAPPPQAFSNPFSCPWPAAPPSVSNASILPLAAQAQASTQFQQLPPPPPPPFIPQTPIIDARFPPQTVSATTSNIPTKSPYTLFTATPMPLPPNATALEPPPPVTNNIRAQILTVSLCLSEIQAACTRSRPTPYSSTSLFRTDIPINHPLKSLLDASLDTILHAVSPRTLQTYLTAWKCFKTFHSSYNLIFPDFSMLTITSFISYLNHHKNLLASSIKGYLSGIQFFHKLIFGSPSPVIGSTQTSMLVKGIQRTHPTRPDARQPITLEILTKCISTLRRGYHSTNTAHTLDTMFILAFFGFLRCSELSITSNFNPNIHPTVSDLSLLDNDTISYFIKQSKTDQMRKGHFIYIFNLPSPIQPYQTLLAYLHFINSQARSTSDPLFTDDYKRPVTRFWFQKHLKTVLLQSGIPADLFSSHSFRIGAATTAAQKGLSQQQIQALGRWSSEAFKTYIRSNRSHIKEAQRTLIS
nr:carbohydrate-responsive element-binding protein-like [Misgurnus anguillicaudatus]